MESTALNTAHCTHCGRRVLLAWTLNEHDDMIEVCAHCDTPLSQEAERTLLGGYKLRALGYEIQGEGPDTEGCGTGSGGGCGSCNGCG